MQTPTSQIVDQAIEKLDAEEDGLIPAEDDKKTDDKATDDAKGAKDDTKSADDKSDSKSGDADKADADDKGEDDKDGEFTADDALEVDEPEQKAQTPTDNAGIQLSVAEQKYIAENIGEPIVIRGIRGTGDDAKEVEIKAYSPNDIPGDFKFANDQQLVAAQTAFVKLEQKANELLGSYRNTQSQASQQEFERREDEGIKADLADLQKEGRFPKFKIQPGQPGFSDDPAAQQVTDVIKIMTERNETYLQQYNQGRPYKHIGFAEAFDIYERSNPAKKAEAKANDDQKVEDAERAKAAERGSSNRGSEASNIVKPTVAPGTTTRDILARLEADDSW